MLTMMAGITINMVIVKARRTGGFVILEETTPICTEIFRHGIKVITLDCVQL